MDSAITPINEKKFCTACYAQVSQEDQFCNTCGYPLNGTEQDQKYFISVRNAKEIDLDEAHKKIKKEPAMLYFI